MCRSGHESSETTRRRCSTSGSVAALNDTKRLVSRHARRVAHNLDDPAGDAEALGGAWARAAGHLARMRDLTSQPEPPLPAPTKSRAAEFTPDRLARFSDSELDAALAESFQRDLAAAAPIEVEMDRRDAARRVEAARQRRAQRAEALRIARLDDDTLDREAAAAIAAALPESALYEAEMDRRDALAVPPDRPDPWSRAEAEDRDRTDPVTNPTLRRRLLSPEAQCRQAYEEHVYTSYLQAEHDCRGVLVNSRGIAKGISSMGLFTSSRMEAEAYASDELKAWWNLNGGRVSYSAFRGQMLGRISDRQAMLNARLNGFDDVPNVA